MTFIIDRFEEDLAVVEMNGISYNIPKVLLPDDAKEGDAIITQVDKNQTENKKQEAKKLLDSLFNERK